MASHYMFEYIKYVLPGYTVRYFIKYLDCEAKGVTDARCVPRAARPAPPFSPFSLPSLISRPPRRWIPPCVAVESSAACGVCGTRYAARPARLPPPKSAANRAPTSVDTLIAKFKTRV